MFDNGQHHKERGNLIMTHSANYLLEEDPEEERGFFIRLRGDWNRQGNVPHFSRLSGELAGLPVSRLAFETGSLSGWDSLLLTFLLKLDAFCSEHGIALDRTGLPDGVQSLLAMAGAVPEREGARREEAGSSLPEAVGRKTLRFIDEAREMIDFIGAMTLVLFRFFRGGARFRKGDLVLQIYNSGAQALPIVSLISFLVGLVLAFVGAVQLETFGAQIYVANLVSLGMAREMGAMMAAIIMAGRTGAAFAAQLGTMKVNEEVDALTTFGISPLEFLVLPRILALSLMMPFLCVYADLIGILGGAFVALTMLDLSPVQYYYQTVAAVGLDDFGVGIFKSVIFGVLVATAGCLRGMQCRGSSSAVGDAATSAVVTGIVSIVVSDSLVTVITSILGI